MSLTGFTVPGLAVLAFFAGSAALFYRPGARSRRLALGLAALGAAAVLAYLVFLWVDLGRPPLRTLGETRLWYALFLPVTGLAVYLRWKAAWMPAFCLGLACLFTAFGVWRPETFDRELLPALQSPWFVPHVIVYIIGYAVLAATALAGLRGLLARRRGEPPDEALRLADNLVCTGLALLTFGLLFGALWAKEAWGHYWTWDPKETWAFLTWFIYLIYIHFRHRHGQRQGAALWMLALAFAVLLVCWFGVNYLPSAANSVHVYAEP